MKKKQIKKLVLSKETVRSLEDLSHVQGGFENTWQHTCASCPPPDSYGCELNTN